MATRFNVPTVTPRDEPGFIAEIEVDQISLALAEWPSVIVGGIFEDDEELVIEVTAKDGKRTTVRITKSGETTTEVSSR